MPAHSRTRNASSSNSCAISATDRCLWAAAASSSLRSVCRSRIVVDTRASRGLPRWRAFARIEPLLRRPPAPGEVRAIASNLPCKLMSYNHIHCQHRFSQRLSLELSLVKTLSGSQVVDRSVLLKATISAPLITLVLHLLRLLPFLFGGH